MSGTHWDRVDAIFAGALALPAEDRATYVAEASEGDRALEAEVHALLEAAEASDVMFGEDDQVRTRLLRRAFSREAPLDAGREIGPYRLLAPLGVGGMGAVYLAERADGQFEQRVAIKLVNHSRVHGSQMIERFLRERQILARLQHPNIARLLDGGVTGDGWPYLVMEYIDGVPLTSHCEARSLPVDGCIQLMQDVGRAVQYAHRNLVVHRDLKPSNILVTDNGIPKLLDFGIARLLEDGLDAELTMTGGGMMTPGYAAPEQLRGEPITTAADVYALGVLLVKLLTGHRPQGEDDVPSGRLPVDLDRISRMALRDEPERRYESVQAFVDDLQRYRESRPVAARPDTLGYRTRKFIARNRAAVAAAVLVTVALAGGLGAALWQADIARTEAARAGEIRDFMLGLFEGTDPELATGEGITIQELLSRASERIDRELAGQPWLQAEMFTLVGSIHRRLGMYEDGRALLQRSVALSESMAGSGSRPHALAILELARLEHRTGAWEVAEERYIEAQGWLEGASGSGSTEVARIHLDRALLGHATGRYEEADSLFVLARDGLEGEGDPLDLLVLDLGHLGTLHTLGDTERIDRVYTRVVANRHLLDDERSTTVAHAMFRLGMEANYRGDPERAEPLLRGALELRRQVYGEEHSEVATTLMALASVSGRLGRREEALALSRQGVESLRATLGAAHPTYAMHLGARAVMVGNYAGDVEVRSTCSARSSGFRSPPWAKGTSTSP
jgi:eukaryotic-like serine/threonine-protein kinase